MSGQDLFERASEAALSIVEAVPAVPRVAVVLGSGIGAVAERLVQRIVIPYARIPHFPTTTVSGHAGNLVVAEVEKTGVFLLQGRFHYYEGHAFEAVTFPIRVLQRLGVETLILTAATGGINPSLAPGTLVCVSDHLNLIGANPLRGPSDERLGVRFLDLSAVYSSRLRTLAEDEARRLGIGLKSGVYACMPGPTYETPAEIRMLRTLGADVVGMSTVPEAIVARHSGMEVLAFALVTNAAAGMTEEEIDHQEVLEAGRHATPRLGALIEAVVKRINADAS